MKTIAKFGEAIASTIVTEDNGQYEVYYCPSLNPAAKVTYVPINYDETLSLEQASKIAQRIHESLDYCVKNKIKRCNFKVGYALYL